MGDVNWRDKDDLELTNADVDAMMAEGQEVGVRGPLLALVRPAPTSATAVTVRAQPYRPVAAWAASPDSPTTSTTAAVAQ